VEEGEGGHERGTELLERYIFLPFRAIYSSWHWQQAINYMTIYVCIREILGTLRENKLEDAFAFILSSSLVPTTLQHLPYLSLLVFLLSV